jgi:hypothetical protein
MKAFHPPGIVVSSDKDALYPYRIHGCVDNFTPLSSLPLGAGAHLAENAFAIQERYFISSMYWSGYYYNYIY